MQLQTVLLELEKTLNAGLISEYPNANYRYAIQAEPGKVYTRIVRGEVWGDNPEIVNRSCFGFLKNEDQTLWKSAGWKAPAKNKARGVLTDLLDPAKVLPKWRYSIS